MHLHPFQLFQRFKDRLHVVLWTKVDGTPSDSEVGRVLGTDRVAALYQIHGNRVIVVRDATARVEQADGLITDTPGLALTVRAADCQTFVVFTPDKNIVGFMHVGWRGLNAGIIPNFFAVLQREWGIAPTHVRVGAGPSLCARCAVFTNPCEELPNIDPVFFKGKHVDLQGYAESQLFSLGLPRAHFERIGACTACHPGYWTYRGGDRDAVKQGSTNVLACVLHTEYHRGQSQRLV